MDALELIKKYSEETSRIESRISLLGEIPIRVIRAWEEGGLFSISWKNGRIERLWLNVIGHNVTVAVLANRLALRLKMAGISEVTEAALVHDWFKRRESEMVIKAKEEGRDPREANRAGEVMSGELLIGIGFSSEIILLTKSTGDIGLEKMMEGDATIAEQLIFYADSCVDNTRITTYKERFDALLPYFQPGGRYDHVDRKFLAQYGKTHREVWDSVVLPIQNRLAELADFHEDPNNLPITI